MDQVLMMKNVIHRRGNLVGNLTKKFDISLGIRLFLLTAKPYDAESPHGGREGHKAERLNAILAHTPGDLRPSGLFSKVWNQEWHLCLPHQSGWCFINRLDMAANEIRGDIGLNGAEPHHVV